VNRIRFGFYDRYENSAFDARPYSITGVESPKVSHYDNRLGANIGGPLKIPHVYNGSDKTYFFVNYQHENEQTAVNTYCFQRSPMQTAQAAPGSGLAPSTARRRGC